MECIDFGEIIYFKIMYYFVIN